MKNRYNIIADLHTHTVASTHAYGTVSENISAAAEKNLKIIALTDHGPSLPGAPHSWHFYNLAVLPRKVSGVIVLRGIEANITGTKGEVDLEYEYLKSLDWVIASFHKKTFPPSSLSVHTDALIKAAENPCVDLLGHPDAPDFEFDIPAVVKACKKNNKLIELNNSSFYIRKGGQDICKKIAIECMNQGVCVAVNSDAHSPFGVGDFSNLTGLLEKIDFPDDLIINTCEKKVLDYINTRKGTDLTSLI